jgi:hypothetical protein
MALRQFVVRTSPLTHEAMIVDAASRDNGRLRAIVQGKEVEIGMDTYMASGSVDLPSAEKIVRAWAKQHNIPETDVMVRVRLPKTNVKPREKARKTNDVTATNLSLVKSAEKPEQDLTAMAQAMQNAHNEQKASANNPEGATVKRTEEEKKATADGKKKRGYTRKTEEQSARSKAAMARYLKELEATSQQSPTIMEPVKPGPGVTQEQIDSAVMELAVAIAKVLKANPGAL